MSGESENLRLRIFGLNKDQVDNELIKIKENNELKIHNIKLEINSLRKENDNLTQYLDTLKSEMKNEMETKEIMEFALKKVEDYGPLIQKVAEDDIKHLTTIGEKTERIFNDKISEFNKIIKQTQEALNTLLKDVLTQSENLSERFKLFMIENGSYNFLATNKGKIFNDSNVSLSEIKSEISTPYSEFKNNLNTDSDEEIESLNEDKEIKESIEIATNHEVLVGENNTSEEKNVQLETTLGQEIKEKDDYKGIFSKALNSELELINSKPVNLEEDVNKRPTSNFWGEEIYEDDKENSLGKILDSGIALKNDLNAENILKDKEKEENLKQGEINNNDYLEQKSENEVIASEINDLRLKYLIGKVTGENLLDNKGNVIVAKNLLITNDIINIAEKEGKLADLIVNMTLPEALE